MQMIEAAPVSRDGNGWWWHPDLPDFGDDNDRLSYSVAYAEWISGQSLQVVGIEMEMDGPGRAIAEDGSHHPRTGMAGLFCASQIPKSVLFAGGCAVRLPIMSEKIREAFNRIHAKIIDGSIASAFSIFKEGYEAGAALAQQPTQAAPDGWKLVPVRATREQVNAVCMHPDLARTLYHSMVEAAPDAPVPAVLMYQTMQRPAAECGCPDCGSSLIDWPKTAAQELVALKAPENEDLIYFMRSMQEARLAGSLAVLMPMSSHAHGVPIAIDQLDAVRTILTADEMRWLRRFNEICEDSDADGHDLPKAAIRQLERTGALRKCGFGRHEVTAFGEFMLGLEDKV